MLTSVDAALKSTSKSIGFTSETMGIFGMINANYDIDAWGGDSDRFFVTVGSFIIPIFGGAGLGWKHYFNSSRAAPFLSASAFGTYFLPVMCSTDDCHPRIGMIAGGSAGYDFHLIKSNRLNMHLQLGLLSQYDLINLKVWESPSDIPELWPIVNIKFYR